MIGQNKFRNAPTVVDGVTFSSKKEARRYGELRLLERAGRISELEMQPAYRLEVNGSLVCKYLADFRYFDPMRGATVVEDVKSPATRKHPVYRIKVKLLKALTGITVSEV